VMSNDREMLRRSVGVNEEECDWSENDGANLVGVAGER
jgi:hypothetical protein